MTSTLKVESPVVKLGSQGQAVIDLYQLGLTMRQLVKAVCQADYQGC